MSWPPLANGLFLAVTVSLTVFVDWLYAIVKLTGVDFFFLPVPEMPTRW